jgi:hypothetical protein
LPAFSASHALAPPAICRCLRVASRMHRKSA